MRPASSNFQPAPRSARGRWLSCALVGALLLAQWLGLVHTIVHGTESTQPNFAIAGVPAAAIDPAGDNAPWLSGLFAAHDEEADCRLFDQASHGSAAPTVHALDVPMVWVLQVFDISQGKALARWAALFDARGPPPPG